MARYFSADMVRDGIDLLQPAAFSLPLSPVARYPYSEGDARYPYSQEKRYPNSQGFTRNPNSQGFTRNHNSQGEARYTEGASRNTNGKDAQTGRLAVEDMEEMEVFKVTIVDEGNLPRSASLARSMGCML